MPSAECRVSNYFNQALKHSALDTLHSTLAMDIALVGTGKTGKAVEKMAIDNGHRVVTRFNSLHPVLAHQKLSDFENCDVVVDFSKPELALPHLEHYCKLNLSVVIGTTGWYDALVQVERWIDASESAVLYAPNFSIGVAVMSRVLEAAAVLINKLPAYDVSLHEAHHQFKLDSPSGTALHLAGILLDKIDRKKQLAVETQHHQIPATDLHVTSQRVGNIFGRHTITFDSMFDEITLSHDAKNRNGFAFGAVRAAEWVAGKKGLFTLDDLISDWLTDD